MEFNDICTKTNMKTALIGYPHAMPALPTFPKINTLIHRINPYATAAKFASSILSLFPQLCCSSDLSSACPSVLLT